MISVEPNNVVPSELVPNLLPTTVVITASKRLASVGVSVVIPVIGTVIKAATLLEILTSPNIAKPAGWTAFLISALQSAIAAPTLTTYEKSW